MQIIKSDFSIIQSKLAEIWKSSEEIKKILAQSEDLSVSDWENIDQIYEKRDVILKDLDVWRQSETGIEVIKNNSLKWDKVIKKIADIDIENLNIIEGRVKSTGDKLKKINKQKNLLLYNREKIKWILNQ